MRKHEGDIVLFFPHESLLFQVAEWINRHGAYALQVIQTGRRSAVAPACRQAAQVIIDASQPAPVAEVLEQALELIEPRRLLAYTEQAGVALEIFVRSRGVAMVLGPLPAAEWDALLQPLEAGAQEGWREGPFPRFAGPLVLNG